MSTDLTPRSKTWAADRHAVGEAGQRIPPVNSSQPPACARKELRALDLTALHKQPRYMWCSGVGWAGNAHAAWQ